MPEASNGDVRISYELIGQGRPLMLLHGWSCDRSWWTDPGYVDALSPHFRLIIVDLRGHGMSDKPHEPAAYRADALVGDALAVADAEGIERFAIWGQSYGGWVAWMTGDAVPPRIAAIVTSGAWDPRPGTQEDWEEFDAGWGDALRRGGTAGLLERFGEDFGEAFDREFPPWARRVTLRADPQALLAAQARELIAGGLTTLDTYPVPALLIAGELEDENDDARRIAGMIPNGDSLRLPGLGHPGACAASDLTVPTARAFLDRWFVV